MRNFLSKAVVLAANICAIAGLAAAQQPTAAKTIFRDSDGKLISNNEFVDIRMANFTYKDATRVTTLEDGTVEFWLQKIPQEGMPARDFTVETLGGEQVTLSDLRGKVVVLNFWFIGCPICHSLTPKLNEFKSKFDGNDDVVFLAMTGDTRGDVRKYLEKNPSTYVQAYEAKPAMDQFVFAGFPKNIVISKKGEIVYWRSNIRAWEKFESVVREEISK
jgi:thiol-disulfide isomerase/thioredoxin